MVVYVAGYPAIYGRQLLYFKDKIFTARAAVDEPKGTDKLRLLDELTEKEKVAI